MTHSYIFSLITVLCCVINISAETTQTLNGNDWVFGQARLKNRYPASVPGVVHTDLMANGLIDDPFLELNERSVQWVDKEDWIYEKSFSLNPGIACQDNIEIVFDGLDTYADVFLNDSLILKADNMFRIWKVDVRPYLTDGKNNLKIILKSPIVTDMPKWDKFPKQYRAANDQSENGGILDRKLSVFARKAGYHYGWDWGPRLVTSGIWRDVRLEGWCNVCIRNVHIRQHDISAKSASINNIAQIEADRDIKGAVITVTDEDNGKIMGKTICDLSRGLNLIPIEFTIKNPRLWWCHNFGKPELYKFRTTVKCPDGKELSHCERIGIRSVEVINEPDEHGTMQFYFVLNGVPVFAKGTNYIPQDSFLPRVTRQRYTQTLKDAVDANMNMIRIWGGGIYEDDAFYDICDELGLMVWQDFMFACSMYPADKTFLDNVRMEAGDNIKRLRNHPSIVIWCGGNECLDAWYNWGWKRQHEDKDPEEASRIEAEMKALYFEVLPQMMEQNDPDSFYWANSPYSGMDKGSDGINGDRHYYGVWQRKHPVSQYNNEKSHFFSEYGVQSFPEYGTVVRYAPDTTEHRLDSDVMMWHQRGGESANSLIAWYLENEYHKPADFKEMLYLNQLFQADAMRTAIEAHRRDMPHCMGSLLWQHDDCWPVASWSTRDYYGNWKAAHYLSRKAFENIIVSSEITGDSIRAYIVSDLPHDFTGQLTTSVYKLNGEKIWDMEIPVTIKGTSSSLVWSSAVGDVLKGAAPSDVVINLSISYDGICHSGNHYLCKQSKLNLPQPEIKYEVRPTDTGFEVSIASNKFVRALYLDIDGEDEHFNDNFFDLLPGESKTCSVNSSLTPEEFKSRLHMTYLQN